MMDGTGDIVIEVKGLWKVFGRDPKRALQPDMQFASKRDILDKSGCVVAVRDISFQVKRGEFFVLMGLSGSGKSTVVRLLLRLIEPTSGQVIINGQDVCTFNEKQLIRLRRGTTSMVFQHFGLLPHRSVLDNVAYALKVKGVPRKQRNLLAHRAIEMVGLTGWESYHPGALSGGMQQRVGIARALASDTQLLIMDEPFSGLDPLIRREMQDQLLEILKKVDKTILFVTHDLDEAAKLGKRIAVMRDGQIMQVGTPEDVITAPSNAYVRDFVQDASLAKVVTAGSIMSEPRLIIHDWERPRFVYQSIRNLGLDYVLLVDETRCLLGVVSRWRLDELVRKGGLSSVREALEPNLPTCRPDTTIKALLPQAISVPFPLPVVDDEGKLLGELNTQAILESMIRINQAEAQEKKKLEEGAGTGV